MSASKNKKKLGVLDAVVIVLILAVVVISAVKIVSENALVSEAEYTVTLSVSALPGEYTEYLNDADYYLSSGQHLGTTVGSPILTPAKLSFENDRGELISDYATDGSVDVKTTVQVKGTMTDTGLMINSTTLTPNMELEITTDYLSVTATIIDIIAVENSVQ